MGDFADYARKDFDKKKNVVASADKNDQKDVQFNVEDAKSFSAPEVAVPDTVVNTEVAAPVVSTGDTAVALGRGLDVGTANLVSSFQDASGNVNLKIQRNAFIDIDCDDYTRNMLTRLGVQYVVVNGRMVVVGDPAFELANIFNRNTRRPMKEGMISPDEADALPIEKMLLETLLEQPKTPGEICYYSVPAEPIDADMNVVYHQGVFGGLLKGLGYEPKPLVEGHAVVFSELAEDDFTGIGISCGGGMFNVCVSYKSIPALSFSTSRGGDWIDRNVASVLGISSSRACGLKEKGIDITNPNGREEEAVEIYYRNLIAYTLKNIKERFESSSSMPKFPDPISIVCAGGTSMIGGFTEVFKQEFEKINFPMDVKEIRLAEDPLYSVSKGCLVAALSESV
ncbi:hypothetical protein OAU96_00165 [Planctomycetota bacterium]|nr:hypothetical protein [Planctomycetota bacterium]